MVALQVLQGMKSCLLWTRFLCWHFGWNK